MARATILEQIVASTREDVARRRAQQPELEADARVRSGTPFADALTAPGISLIAEHKRASPSAGTLRAVTSVTEIVRAYERGGARAISVLTEERHFGGSLQHLRQARAATALPILRKDFVIDPYQLREAAAAGADAVLLIVAALEPATLIALHDVARELGLETLVEVHDAEELTLALELPGAVVGINNRDLHDFSVDVARTHELLPAIPAGRIVVSESGLADRGALEQLARAGVHGALIGEALMSAADPERACRHLLPSAAASRTRPTTF